jgi:hypothetical protein
MVVLEPALHNWLKKSTKAQGLSISQAIRDLVRDAYREQEDKVWAAEGDKRLASFDKNKSYTHEAAWK